MKAEDTVMSILEMDDAMNTIPTYQTTKRTQTERFFVIAKAQAEISFKAGYKHGAEDRYHIHELKFEEGKEMAGQRINIYFTMDTLKELKEFIVKKHGTHKAMSITVECAVKEFLKNQKELDKQH